MTKVREVMQTDVVTCSPEEEISRLVKKLRINDVSGLPVTENYEVIGIVSEADVLDLIDEEQEERNIWLPSPFEAIELPLRAFPWREWMEKHGLIKEVVTDIGELPIREIMSKKVITADPNESIEEVASKMKKNNINRLPVVENHELVGIITRGDIIKSLSN